MKIEKFVTLGVNELGIVAGGGAVETKPFLRIGDGTGCGLPDCHCSDGYWLSIGLGRIGDKVEGIKVTFKNKAEYNSFFKEEQLYNCMLK